MRDLRTRLTNLVYTLADGVEAAQATSAPPSATSPPQAAMAVAGGEYAVSDGAGVTEATLMPPAAISPLQASAARATTWAIELYRRTCPAHQSN